MRPISLRVSRRLPAALMAFALLASSLQVASAANPQDRFKAGKALKPTGTIVGDFSKAAKTADGKVAIIVKLSEDSVASYSGGVSGMAATSPKATGQSKIDFKSGATTKYRAYLKGKQDAFVTRLAKVQGTKATGRFDLVLNGVSAVVPADDVAKVAALPGVEAVYPDVLLKLDTDATPQFIGATSAWSTLGGQEKAGEGVIVGVLDTGIWPEHPSFSDPDPAGKPYAAPTPAPDGSRACQFSGGANPGPAFTCNNKLIGAARFMSTYDAVVGLEPGEFTSARDDDGHGTHTSSTAAGNGKVAASIFGISRGIVSGIAPRAKVEMFKVCGAQGCFGSDSAAAVQAAIGDGVNVINFSISGGENPYSDAVELAFLDAYNAGIFVAASAGNSGPAADTTAHRGPWVTTVAASTGPRAFVNKVNVTGGGASLSLNGVSLTKGVGPAPIIVNTADPFCLVDAAPGTFTGKIVVCERGGGGGGRVEKGKFVFDGGAVGMVLYNQDAATTDQETDNHFLPASHIQFSQGTTLLAFLTAHPGAMATLTQGVKGTQQSDVMASFSSRGGSGQSLGVSKPDITAPGVQILAGNSPQHVGVAGGPQGELFQAIAGTSMSSPHIAGSAALVRAINPTFTPGQIKSALMTTARTAGLVKEDGTTPFDAFDAGSGRVDLSKAGNPGITFDVTGADYLAHPNDLYTVNYPSIYHPTMPGVVTLQRTAQSVITRKSEWTLSTKSPSDFKITVPHSISVNGFGKTTFNIKLDASAVPLGQTRFGTIILKQKNGTRVLHMPVTIVRGQEKVLLTKACAPTNLTVGATTSCSITATNPTFGDVNFLIEDRVPSRLKLVKSSVVNARVKDGNLVQQFGTIPAAEAADVHLAPGASIAGFLPLSIFGVAPIAGVGDDTITTFNVPTFLYGGEEYSSLGVSSNGYIVVGTPTGADNSIHNQNFPDPARPNNVMAGFWTDLDPSTAGTVSIGTLTDGVDEWIVVEWNGVREFSTAGNTHSFQIWIGEDTDTNPAEDISYAYGDNTGTGDLGSATVGVENKFGNRGNTTFYNGAGTLPTNGTELRVTSTAGSVSSVVVKFDAKAGKVKKPWTNCATLESDAFLGVSYSCVRGTIH
jgi:subtilisin family serine protease